MPMFNVSAAGAAGAGVASCAKIGNAAAKASQFVLYPEAPHAFHADYRPTYREKPAADGWSRALDWLKRNA